MKKFLLGCTYCFTLVITAGLASAETQAQVIGRIFFDLSHPYQQADAKHYEAYAKELGIKALTIDGKASMDEMMSAMDNLIAQGVHGIIVQPLDGAVIASSVDAAHQANIPVVVFFQNVKGTTCPYVRINERDVAIQMGQIAAQKFQEIWPGKKINIGIIDQPTVEYVQINRSNAFIEGVQRIAADATVVSRLDGYGARDTAYKAAEEMLQAHPEVNLVYGINGDSALGALSAFQAAGRGKAQDGIPLTEIIVSTDGSTLECLEIVDPASALKLTMALSPKNNAHILTDTLLKVMRGEIALTAADMVDTNNLIINGWTDDLSTIQSFVSDEYFANVNLQEEVAKRKK